jgi:hypothetical protein
MPTAVSDSIARSPGRTGWNLVATRGLLVLTAMLLSGCAGTSSLLSPPSATVEVAPDDGRPADAASRVPLSPAKADSAVVRTSAVVQAEASQSPPASPAGSAAPGLPDLIGGDQPEPAASVDVTAPFLGQPGPAPDGPTLYRYDPMRGAALSRTPPPNRDITLRELLGLGRSDIADKEVEVKPNYPRLHDDPLAGSPVPPAERDRPLLPWLSNLFFEHNGELNEDADDARDDVLRRRSNHDVTFPGPDTANFPNSAFTLPKGRAYIETSPVTFFGKSGNNSFAAQYNWEFLLRYGLTDDLEFRFFSSGYAVTLSRKPPTSGFSPLVFDFKYHMWDENLDKHIPAAGVEIYILTPFGSNYFNGGTQPSIALLLDHTLPFDILLEHNFGLTGIEDTFGGAVYEFSYQWALQRQVFKDFAIFTHGFLNSAGLPRTPIFQRHIDSRALTLTPGVDDQQSDTASDAPKKPVQVVVGLGFLWNWSERLAFYGSYNWGLTPDSPKTLALMGFTVAF